MQNEFDPGDVMKTGQGENWRTFCMVWERFGDEYLKSTKITCLIPQYFVKPSICLQIGKYVIIKKSIYISTSLSTFQRALALS